MILIEIFEHTYDQANPEGFLNNVPVKLKGTILAKTKVMGRPKASDVSRTVASLFANVVTVPSNVPNDWVARTGDHSIFNVLSHLIPKVMSSNICFSNFPRLCFFDFFSI